MKKHIILLTIMLTLLTVSCKKKNTNNGGSFTFKGATFNSMGSSAIAGPPGYNSEMTAGTGTASDNTMYINFSNPRLPFASGKDTVIGIGTAIGNQVQISLLLGSTLSTGTGGAGYHSTGGNGSNQTVQVTVNSAGKISVSGTSIMMVNDTLASDSSALSFSISQTN